MQINLPFSQKRFRQLASPATGANFANLKKSLVLRILYAAANFINEMALGGFGGRGLHRFQFGLVEVIKSDKQAANYRQYSRYDAYGDANSCDR